MKLVALSTFVSILAFAGVARAAGFSVDVQSARATGMATAVTGMIDDSSAVFYNPAGIARGRVFDAQVSDSLIMPMVTFKDTNGVSTTTPFSVAPPFQVYAAGGITNDISIGIGLFEPYGLSVSWPAGWEGRSLITYAQLASYYVNPTVAFRLGPLRVGGGAQIVYSTVDLKRDIALPGGAFGATELGASTWGIGGNVGVQVDAVRDVLTFGAHYRSAVALSYDGPAHFDGIPDALAGTLHDQSASTRVVMPDSFAFGAALRPIKPLVIDLDVVYYNWTHFRSIDITFPNDASGTLSSSQPKNWAGVVNVHLGAEYAINDTWRVRGGVFFDPTPSPEDTLTPDIPDATRMNFAVGGTYRHKSGLYVDLGYELIVLLSQTSTAPQLPGTYSGYANIVGLGVGFKTSPPRPVR